MDLERYQQLVSYLDTLILPPTVNKEEQLRFKRQTTYYFLRDNILYRRNPLDPNFPLRVVTKGEVELVLRYFHTDLLAGHFAFQRTYQKIAERYYWPGMRKDVYDYVRTCDVCQRRGHPQRKPEPLHPLVVGQPFDRVGIDMVGPLQETKAGNRYIVVATDYLTKWPEALPVSDGTAETAARFLFDQILTRHGAPRELLSDRGKTFLNRVIDHLCGLWNAKHALASAYHPMTNGLVERYNKTLAETLAKVSFRCPFEWDELVPAALFAYRTARQETTKHTPFYLLYGREPTYPVESTVETYPHEIPTEEDLSDVLLRRTFQLYGPLVEARSQARTNILREQKRQKRRYDKNVKPQEIQEGDLVLLYRSARAKTRSGKLEPKWTGPFRVHSVVGNGVYRLATLEGNVDERPVNVQRLKTYHQRSIDQYKSG
jgi:hypothetical protein